MSDPEPGPAMQEIQEDPEIQEGPEIPEDQETPEISEKRDTLTFNRRSYQIFLTAVAVLMSATETVKGVLEFSRSLQP